MRGIFFANKWPLINDYWSIQMGIKWSLKWNMLKFIWSLFVLAFELRIHLFMSYISKFEYQTNSTEKYSPFHLSNFPLHFLLTCFCFVFTNLFMFVYSSVYLLNRCKRGKFEVELFIETPSLDPNHSIRSFNYSFF